MEIHLNPADESPRVLLALAAMLTTLASGGSVIAEADRPDTGATERGGPTIKELIAGGRLTTLSPPCSTDLAAAFGGAGNGAGLLGSVPSQPPALIDAGSPTIPIPSLVPDAVNPGPDLAAAFGGSNSGPLVPPNGAPPVPNNGAPTVGASTLELDADGLPWNAEIHSSNKKMAATGKWMARRNVSDAVLARVTAQLRAAVSVGNSLAPAGAPPPPPIAPPIPMAIPLPPTTPGTAGSDAITLPMLLPRITTAVAAGHLTPDTARAIALDISDGKIDNVAMLAIAPQLIPLFWGRLDQLGIAR